MKKVIVLLLMFLVIVTLGCTPELKDEDSTIIDVVKIMEQNEHQLINFQITYDQYKENTDKFLFKNFRNIDNEVLFSLDGKEYKGSDLVGVSQEEMIRMKEKIGALQNKFGKQKLDVVNISDVYSDDRKDWKYVFTKQIIRYDKFPDEMLKYKKYMFIKSENSWVIMSIDKSIDRVHSTESNKQDIQYKYTFQAQDLNY